MSLLIYAIGFLAQGFFSARILVQWIMSEKAHRVLSPTIFWVFSVIGSYLLFLYGFLRQDFAIILGQFISCYVYLWNLKAKGVWIRIPLAVRLSLLVIPFLAVILVAGDTDRFVAEFLHNRDVPLWLLIYGSTGQVIFTLRFVYQFLVSRRKGISELPPGFWMLSLVGSLMIVSYAIFRLDPVLIVGQSFGLVAYTRNLMIGRRSKRIH